MSSTWTLVWIWIPILMVKSIPMCTNPSEVEVVCFADTSDNTLERGLVSNNNVTMIIMLRNCRITDIDPEAFEYLSNLQQLDISHNSISTLAPNVLDDVSRLKYFNISYNSISDIPSDLFDSNPNLEVLDLEGNNIRTIKDNTFRGLHKLKHLDLSSNRIMGRNLNAKLFESNPNITYLNFSGNNMSSTDINIFRNFNSLKILKLHKCNLEEVPNFIIGHRNLNTLVNLVLSSNQIADLLSPIIFNDLINLEILDLADNAIRNIGEKVLEPLKKLKKIVLRYNLLENLPENIFKNKRYLGNIDLSFNKLKYIPVNAFRETALKNLNLAGNKFTFLPNNFCLELRNSGVFLAKFYFNRNPWQCWCLQEVLKEVNKYGITYNKAQYGGQEPVCVTAENFNCVRDMNLVRNYVIQYKQLIKK